jgi:hypothetical protein
VERVDHLKLIAREEAEVERMVKIIRSGVPGTPLPIRIDHEKDGGCCRREPWDTTLAFIVGLVDSPHPIHAYTAVDARHRDGPVPIHLRTKTRENVHECSLNGFAQTSDPKKKKLYVVALVECETGHGFNVGLCRGCAETLFDMLKSALIESTEHN